MIEIRCNGKVISGFTSVSVSKGLDSIAASYSMGVFGNGGDSAWVEIFPGDEVEIAIDGETILKGYNVTTNPSFNNSGIVCQVVGGEKTIDLVDCTAKTTSFENKKVDEIVSIICNDFGLRFTGTNGADVGSPLKKFSTDVGATAWNVMVAACMERNVYPMSDGLGNISLIGSSHEAAETDIVQGENVLSASGSFSVANRFSKYTIYSSKDAKGKTNASMSDEGMTRTRELVLLDERFGNKEGCEARALWEAKHRQAIGNTLSVVVSGWKQKEGGHVWRPGLMVNCDLPKILGETMSFLVNRVTFTYGGNGTNTTLELVDKDIYLPMPKLAPKAKKKEDDIWKSVRQQTGSKLKTATKKK